MDDKTIKALIAEAKKNHRKAKAAWIKHDNSEDMHEMEMWDNCASWLESKMP